MANVKVDNTLVEYVARLARLKLTEEEKKILVPQLKDIVQYVEKLGMLDVGNVEPADHVLDISNVMREDKASISFSRQDILENAPSTDGTYFEVPRIV